ncbi:MAG: hypothetical protein DWI21_13970 [Planctomycetota bacterium]|nr:MAG: hypothetical protein DWI21_13970 [Planctomycetota bacterium]
MADNTTAQLIDASPLPQLKLPRLKRRAYVHCLVKIAQYPPTTIDIPALHALGDELQNRTQTDRAKAMRGTGSSTDNLTKLMLAARNATADTLSYIAALGARSDKLKQGFYTEEMKREVVALEKWFANNVTPPSTIELQSPVVQSDLGQSSEPLLLSSPEGKRLLKLHSKRERKPALAKEKKRLVQAECGCLRCAVCNFDFLDRYGSQGDGFIECHHTKPLSNRLEEEETLLEDLELVCANCHRMLHRGRQMLSISELRAMLR